MPTTGSSLRTWTFFLLLFCHVPDFAVTQAAGETVAAAAGSGGISTPYTSSVASSPILSPNNFVDPETACLFRTINYITHTLPQQCAKSSWSAPAENTSTSATAREHAAPSLHMSIQSDGQRQGNNAREENDVAASTKDPQEEETTSVESVIGSGTESADTEAELETDSPLDNANFLSFEEWKKQNLAQVGQSPENIGQRGAASSNQPARRRPVNVNALDSLGDEGEIEIDFTGFGPPTEGGDLEIKLQRPSPGVEAIKTAHEEGKVAPSSWSPSKDAGKTCKERFNYASFDCAATVLKANKQAKSLSSILVENKDSYMLNECSADNKFLIIELCDDILADTIVLANYEFFSSMFRHFSVSVSDRYPVKMERWRTLGTFEARNSRDIQPFLITEPQIWARYLRVEFLTQYGNEFYCPLSLLRVHGTTMMEQFRREEEEARGLDDDEELHEATQPDLVIPAEDSGPLPPDQIPIEPIKKNDDQTAEPAAPDSATKADSTKPPSDGSGHGEQEPGNTNVQTKHSTAMSPSQPTDADKSDGSSDASSVSSQAYITQTSEPGSANITAAGNDSDKPSEPPSSTDKAEIPSQAQNIAPGGSVTSQSPVASQNENDANSASNASSSSSPQIKANSNGTAPSPQSQTQSRNSPTQPNPAAPSTQESFYKSIHKRLMNLEANSTLSLQYIEEQSRILRDAFVKVEKRQLAKTEKFLDHLNNTVMQELKSYRNMYDQLWQSTIIELESMKERQKAEIGEIGTRLSLMADELVWQKRMAVVQSTLLLLCLFFVLFVRSGTLGSGADVPIVQQLGSKYSSFFETSPPRSPEVSGLSRRRRTFRNMWRSDTSAGLSDHQSDGQPALSDIDTDGRRSPDTQIEYNLPTPNSPSALSVQDTLTDSPINDMAIDPAILQTPLSSISSLHDHAKRVHVLETQSGPATPKGTRDSKPSWEEVDRAIDLLQSESTDEPMTKKERARKKRASALRRVRSSYDGPKDDVTRRGDT